MKDFLRKWELWVMISTITIAACAPTLSIRHEDPSTREMLIELNGKSQGKLRFGQKRSFSLKEGFYRLQVISSDDKANIWSEDGQPWMFFLEDEASLVLFSPQGRQEEETDLRFLNFDGKPVVIQEEEVKPMQDHKLNPKKGQQP